MAHTEPILSVERLASNRASSHKDKKDSRMEVMSLFTTLHLWTEESQKEFSNIVNSHRSSINEAIDDLVGEVSELQEKLSLTKKERNCLIDDVNDLQLRLSVMTKERNDLLERVDNLSGEIRQFSNELPIMQVLPEPDEYHEQDTGEVGIPEVGAVNVKEEDMDETGLGNDVGEDKHVNYKSHVCEECGYAAAQRVRLTCHMESVHKIVLIHQTVKEMSRITVKLCMKVLGGMYVESVDIRPHARIT